MEKEKWILFGKENHYHIMIIMQDLEDRTYYPMYFYNESEVTKHSNNIISESKCKIIEVCFF